MKRSNKVFFILIFFFYSLLIGQQFIDSYIVFNEQIISKKYYPYVQANFDFETRRLHSLMHETMFENENIKINVCPMEKKSDNVLLIRMPKSGEMSWKFHDDSKVSALDFVSSLFLAKEIGVISKNHFSSFSVNSGGDVEVFLSQPVPLKWAANQLEQLKIIPHSYVSSYIEKYKNNNNYKPYKDKKIKSYLKNPTGSGPFKLIKGKNKTSKNLIHLELYDDYLLKSESKRAIKGVRVKKQTLKTQHWVNFNAKDINMVIDMPYSMISTFNPEIHSVNQVASQNVKKIIFNFRSTNKYNKKAHLRNPYFRKAIIMAIDRFNIFSQLFGGQGDLLSGPYWKHSPKNNPSIVPYRYDTEEARKIINGLKGYKVEKSNSGEYSIEYNGDQVNIIMLIRKDVLQKEKDAIETLKDELNKFGFDVQLKSVSKALWSSDLRSTEWDMAYFETTQDQASSVSVEYGTQKNIIRNYSGYSNSDLDDLFAKESRCTTIEDCARVSSDIHAHLHINAVSMFLWTLDKYYVLNREFLDQESISDKVNGYNFFTDPEKWKLAN